MKTLKIILIILIIALPFNLFAQNYAELQNIKLTDSVSCAVAQKKVVECSDYLFSNPNVENMTSVNAMSFIIKWMSATPTYMFSLNHRFFNAIKSDLGLAGRYHAALAKTAIENNYTKDCFDLQFKAITLLLNYCEKEKNFVKITKKLREYIEAKNNKELEKLLK